MDVLITIEIVSTFIMRFSNVATIPFCGNGPECVKNLSLLLFWHSLEGNWSNEHVMCSFPPLTVTRNLWSLPVVDSTLFISPTLANVDVSFMLNHRGCSYICQRSLHPNSLSYNLTWLGCRIYNLANFSAQKGLNVDSQWWAKKWQTCTLQGSLEKATLFLIATLTAMGFRSRTLLWQNSLASINHSLFTISLSRVSVKVVGRSVEQLITPISSIASFKFWTLRTLWSHWNESCWTVYFKLLNNSSALFLF